MNNVEHYADLCVVGGGIAGICTAIAAARHGAKVVLMQDRPVFGGNASSEIRMNINGARGENNRETGIIEELILENLYRNQNFSWSIWDTVLYGAVKCEKNITSLLNCSCLKAEMNNNSVACVTGWQMTSETYHTVRAKYYADCSGDSILAPLTNAQYMLGREARVQFNESIQPEVADKCTMGMSCLMKIREYTENVEFIAPKWANKYPTDESLPSLRWHNSEIGKSNYWWIEIGGDKDSIHDTEECRDELIKISLGIWDHLKNYGNHGAEKWDLDWIGFLPGKRESRRYVGEYIINQNDVEAEGKFDDVVAYGGWTMDDHDIGGIYSKGEGTIHHAAPSPWGIGLKSLYSKNIDNLVFAGRNISATHAAFSSSRVMATCGVVGQAVGTAVAQAINDNKNIRDINIKKLQQTLMYDDCYIPFVSREISQLTKKARTNAEVLKSGIDRPTKDGNYNSYIGEKGKEIIYEFDDYVYVKEIRIVFDSLLSRKYNSMPKQYPIQQVKMELPKSIVREYILLADTTDGEEKIVENNNNFNRMVKHSVNRKVKSIKLIPKQTWGDEKVRIFAMDIV